jgi:hypothetical protein
MCPYVLKKVVEIFILDEVAVGTRDSLGGEKMVHPPQDIEQRARGTNTPNLLFLYGFLGKNPEERPED